MSWLYQRKQPVATKHNGTMMLSRRFGVWTLWGHDGTFQASPYMDGVWKKTVRYLLRRSFEPRRCLVLGVAMGGTFNILQQAWPDADIVGIDWEPELLKLGQQLGVYRPGPRVTFVEGDAATEITKLEEHFDLIVVDLFNGSRVDAAVFDDGFRLQLARHLAEGGVIAVNWYLQPKALQGWPGSLGTPQGLRYKYNGIGIFGGSWKH